MESKRQKPAHALDRAIDEIRNTHPDPAQVEEAAARVWARIAEGSAEVSPEPALAGPETEAIRGCGDYQSLIPEYLAGRLSSARTLLLEDHSRECLPCRKALTSARSSEPHVTSVRRPRRNPLPTWQWAAMGIAATLLLAVGIQQSGLVGLLLFPVEVHASAQTVRGQLFRLDGQQLFPITAGAEIGAGEPIRTAANSGAIIELDDGSRIEMRERSEISLMAAADGIRIRLERGSIIVRAAEQRSGHLYVSTDDIEVSVVGTVFSVSEGAKGSRVSVIEGEVHVENESTETALFPGEQFNSTESLTLVPIEQEIAWSQELELHIALLSEFSRARDQLRDAIASQGLRYSSNLLDIVPADTVMYVAFPNVALTLTNAYDVFKQRIDENPVIQRWWNESAQRAGEEGNLSIEQMIEQVRALSGLLGNEVVLALGRDGNNSDPLLLAEVTDAEDVVILLRAAIAISPDPEVLHIVTTGAEVAALAGSPDPVVYVEGGLLVFSSSAQRVADVLDTVLGGTSAFAATEFYGSLATAYGAGTEWLFAADIDALIGESSDGVPEGIGINNLQDLVIDYKVVAGQSATRAIMNFDQTRAGIASWLGTPAPMGGLDYVSPDTFGVVAGLTKDPASIVGELFDTLRTMDPEAWNDIATFQQEHMIDIQYDVASPLGGEFVIAIDGPLLPTPAWKVVTEVYDSARFQNTIERLISEFNQLAAAENHQGIELTAESVGGQIYQTVSILETGSQVHYTYSGGYMIMAPSRALVSNALQYNQSRYTLARSDEFQSRLPAGGLNYCSAILYQNMTPMLATIADYIPLPEDTLTDGQIEAIRETAANTPATMVCVTAETDRIVASNQGELAFNLITLGGFSILIETLEQVQRQQQ